LKTEGVTVREDPPPARPEGFALLRLLVGGICNTDLELQRGYYGFAGTPGHEFVAEVVEADTPELLGKARGWRNQPCLHALRMVPQEGWAGTAHSERCWGL
jgi:threonine dehydrogenase-like Zn-dependent dehydrogenase